MHHCTDRAKRVKQLEIGVIDAAIENGITVAEVTFSNSISVSEHVVVMILALVRNYLPSYQWVIDGGWNIADCVSRSYDLEGMEVGTVGQGGSAPRCRGGSSPSRWGCTTPIVTASPSRWSESSASPIGHSSTKDWPRRNPVRL